MGYYQSENTKRHVLLCERLYNMCKKMSKRVSGIVVQIEAFFRAKRLLRALRQIEGSRDPQAQASDTKALTFAGHLDGDRISFSSCPGKICEK